MLIRSCHVPNCPHLARFHCCGCGLDYCNSNHHPNHRAYSFGFHDPHCCGGLSLTIIDPSLTSPTIINQERCSECNTYLTPASFHCCCCRRNLCSAHACAHEHHRVSPLYRSLNNKYWYHGGQPSIHGIECHGSSSRFWHVEPISDVSSLTQRTNGSHCNGSNNNNIYSNGCNSYSNNYNSNSIGSSTTPQRKLFMKQVLDDPMSEVYQTYQVLRTRSSPLQMYLIEIVDLCTNQEAGVTEIIMPYMTCNLRTFATQRLKDSFHSLLRENHDMIQWNIHSLCLVLDMMHQCANGLQCWNEIAQKRHNDVKPENFLVDDGHALNFSSFSNFCVYLADLDESDDNYSCSNRSRSGTLHYFPPETGTRRSTRSDIWSFGVMCLELLCLLHQLHYSNEFGAYGHSGWTNLGNCNQQEHVDQFLTHLQNKMKHSILSSLDERGIEMNETMVVFSECVSRLLSLCRSMLKIDACQRKDWTNILNELKSIMLMLLYSLHDVTTLVFSDRTKTVLMEDISLIFRYQYPWKKHKLNSPLIDTNDPTVFDQALIHSKSEKKEREYILSKRQHSPSIGNEMEFSPNSPTQISIQYENRYRMYSVEKLKDGSKKFLDSIFQSRYTNILCTHKWPKSFFKPFILSKYMENITTLQMDGNYEVLDGMGSIRLKNVTELDVTNMEPCTIEIIAGVFSNLRSLILNENRMGPLSAKLISESFKQLTKLDLSGNAIGDEGANHLANSVHLQHLVKLYLINNDIGAQGAICIATSPNLTQLQVLNLCRNSIGPKGIGALASSNNMKNLTELGLSYCSIGHEGAMYICSSISFTNLTSLYLIGNSLTETDISLILQKLKKLKQASLFAKPSLDRK